MTAYSMRNVNSMSYLDLLSLSKRYWAAALNLGLGAAPQHPPKSGPQARRNKYEWMSVFNLDIE
jgi:hypothetical protein